jgi:hypothetical protein
MGEESVTKKDLIEALAASDERVETNLLNAFHDRIEVVRAELLERDERIETNLLKAFHDRIEVVRAELLEGNERVETNLLKAFRKWAMRFETKVNVNGIEIEGLKERMLSLEERFDGFEERQ